MKLRVFSGNLSEQLLGEPAIAQQIERIFSESYAELFENPVQLLTKRVLFECQRLYLIEDQKAVRSFCFSRDYDLKKTTDIESSYFTHCSDETRNRLTGLVTNVQTAEWVTVRQQDRKAFTKVRQADLIMGCLLRHMKFSNNEAAMGYSRVDMGADRIAMCYGSRPIGDTQLFGIDCKVMLALKSELVVHRIKPVAELVDALFNQYYSADNSLPQVA